MSLLRRIIDLFGAGVGSTESQRSPKWEAFRRSFLRDNPECAACGTRENLEVHHMVPFHRRPEMELDRNNCITLCRDDHLTFGHLKDWKSWNDMVAMDCMKYREKVRKRP